MDRAVVITSLVSRGLFNGIWDLDDMAYEPISSPFVEEARAAWLETLPDELTQMTPVGNSGKSVKTVRWVSEVFDCDNIARDFGVYLSRCMAAKAVREGSKLGNVAAGKINFQPSAVTGHAVNWFVDHDGYTNVYDAGSGTLNGIPPAQLATVSSGETI